jgi:O-antigen/teichoic acid export membrane protein
VVTTVILDSVWSVVIATLTTSLVDVVGTHVIAPRRARLGWDFALFRELYRYGRHIWFVGILIFLVTQLDDAVVGRVQGLEQLSLYAIAYTIANIPIVQISAVVGQVGMPAWSAALRQGDVEGRNRMFVSTVRLSGAITIALCAALMAGGPELLELVFGAKWRPAYSPLVILLFFGLVRGISANFGALFNSLGRPGIISADIGTKVVIIAALIYPMTEAYGIVGAALSVTLPMVVITPIAAALYFRIAGISARAVLATLVRPTAACIPATIVAIGLRVGLDGAVAPGLLRTITVSLVPTIATAGVVLGIAWVTDPELRRLLARRAPAGEAGGEGAGEPPARDQLEST